MIMNIGTITNFLKRLMISEKKTDRNRNRRNP